MPLELSTQSKELPSIAVVTPTYNQADFLEKTMQSVLEQNYPGLQYVVVDGGSNDHTRDVIHKHENRLHDWISEPDKGQYDAVNKGFARTDADVMAYLNGDDLYTPSCLSVVGEVFAQFPEVQWITTLYPIVWDRDGRAVRCSKHDGFSKQGFYHGENLPGCAWPAHGFIQQESTFWRRSLWEHVGGKIDASLQYAGDFDLWARFYKYAPLHGVEAPLGGFRVHGDQKTEVAMAGYLEEAKASLHKHGGKPWSTMQAWWQRDMVRRLPGPMRRAAWKLGLSEPRWRCTQQGRLEGWCLRAA